MSNGQDQSRITDWQKAYDFAMHSNGISADLGLFVLKTLIVVNGGALVTLIAAYPHLRNQPGFASNLPDAGTFFFWGLVAGIAAAILGYFYMRLITHGEWTDMAIRFPVAGATPPKQWARPISKFIFLIALLLIFSSLGTFLRGAETMLDAFKATQRIEKSTNERPEQVLSKDGDQVPK